ncbi:hypothetical protein [Flavobacterium rhizosphaerae]|uniref:Histidine kinase n=1 Tax=Flavobacterium rhizosphaerae TaxID=3163298 RepID=A0ABW8YRC5_9FLAO
MTIIEISKYIGKMSPLLSGTGFFIGMLFYKRLNGFYRSLSIFLGLMLIIELAMRLLGNILGYNYIFQPYYAITEIAFFIYFYNKYLLSKKYKALLALQVFICVYDMAEILYYAFNPVSPAQFQSYGKPLGNFLVIIMVLTYFYEKINSFDAHRAKHIGFNLMVFLYFSCSTLVFLPFNFMLNESTGIKFYFWTFNAVLIFIFYSYLCLQIIKNLLMARDLKLHTNMKL